MAEIKTYGFLIGLDECIRRRNELVYDMKKCNKGFVGVTPEPHGLGQILLYDSLDNRNEAMKYFKGLYQTVKKVPVEIFVDEKWVKGEKPKPEDFGDDDFTQMMKEIEQSALEKAKEDFKEKERVFNNTIGEYKSKISELEKTISMMETKVSFANSKVDEVRKEKDKTIKGLNKDINKLESRVKMLEHALQRGED